MCGYEGAAVPPACVFGPRDDARPPHEQGTGALRFGSDGAAVGADDGRPTSRGLPSAKACVERRCLAPRGQGERCRCAYSTLFAPAGQRRCGVGAPDFGLSRGEGVCGAGCPSRAVWQARRGTGRRGGGVLPVLSGLSWRACQVQNWHPAPAAAAFTRRRPAGRTAGSARTRSRDPSLENPFLGNGAASFFRLAPPT